MNKQKIGVGVLTFNSQGYFETLYNSIDRNLIDSFVVINGGNPYTGEYPNCHWVQHETNKYPSVCRNEAVEYLLGQDCEHIFLIEDDMEILDPNIFNKYIEVSQKTGLKYLCHASTSDGSGERFDRTPKCIVQYPNKQQVAFYPNMCNEFTYHHVSVFEALSANGEKTFYDENMRDAFDIDLTYRESSMPHAAPFWHFADIVDSDQYIRNNPIALSRLQANGARANTIAKVWEYFQQKHGIAVNQIPVATELEFKNKLMKIYESRVLPKYDIFIPCIKKDFNKLGYVIESCLQYLDPEHIVVCCPESDFNDPSLNDILFETVHVIAEENIIKNAKILKHMITFRPNWIFQQFLKMCQDFTPNDYFLSVDADTIFRRPLQMFGNNDKPNWFYGWEQHHQPYFDFMKQEFGIDKKLSHTGIGDIGFFDKRIVKEWLDANSCSAENMIARLSRKMTPNYHFSEFETYANYVHGKYNYVKLDQQTFGKRLDAGEDWTDSEIIQKINEWSGKCDTLQLHSWKI